MPVDQKKKQDARKACISSLSAEFPEDCKIFPADAKDDCQKVGI
jgi:pre-rRNA-processing protein TSR1